jgi:hypothetical protein
MMEDWNVEDPVFCGVDFKWKFFIFEYWQLGCQEGNGQ